MKWQEVRELYPNKFVKFKVLDFEEIDNTEIIHEVAVIGPIKAEDATRELLSSKNNTLVYHTSKEEVILKVRKPHGLRRKI